VGHVRTRGVEPWHQQHWDWKAASNFICGGAGAGLFIFAAGASLRAGSLFPLGFVALGIGALGLFLLLFKIGRPWRFIHVLRQPRRSWMAREAWIAAAFFPLGALASWFDLPAVTIAAAIFGLLFLLSQAMILKEAKGIPAWRTTAILPLLISTGFAEGAGLFLIATVVLPSFKWATDSTAAAVVLLAALRSWTWHGYRTALAVQGAPLRTFAALDRFRPAFFALGLAAPMALIVAGFVATDAAPYLFALAGCCVLIAGSALKLVLVTRAAFNQGFALMHTPLRGRGAAGPAIKPGWSMP
jgi:phenylacetyl-CoA:acceptor oxidoreductase subunit 2